MSTYISYRVKVKDSAEELRIDADDVEVTCPCGALAEGEGDIQCNHEAAWFNFTKGDDDQTVAAIPYSQVVYIID